MTYLLLIANLSPLNNISFFKAESMDILEGIIGIFLSRFVLPLVIVLSLQKKKANRYLPSRAWNEKPLLLPSAFLAHTHTYIHTLTHVHRAPSGLMPLWHLRRVTWSHIDSILCYHLLESSEPKNSLMPLTLQYHFLLSCFLFLTWKNLAQLLIHLLRDTVASVCRRAAVHQWKRWHVEAIAGPLQDVGGASRRRKAAHHPQVDFLSSVAFPWK